MKKILPKLLKPYLKWNGITFETLKLERGFISVGNCKIERGNVDIFLKNFSLNYKYSLLQKKFELSNIQGDTITGNVVHELESNSKNDNVWKVFVDKMKIHNVKIDYIIGEEQTSFEIENLESNDRFSLDNISYQFGLKGNLIGSVNSHPFYINHDLNVSKWNIIIPSELVAFIDKRLDFFIKFLKKEGFLTVNIESTIEEDFVKMQCKFQLSEVKKIEDFEDFTENLLDKFKGLFQKNEIEFNLKVPKKEWESNGDDYILNQIVILILKNSALNVIQDGSASDFTKNFIENNVADWLKK